MMARPRSSHEPLVEVAPPRISGSAKIILTRAAGRGTIRSKVEGARRREHSRACRFPTRGRRNLVWQCARLAPPPHSASPLPRRERRGEVARHAPSSRATASRLRRSDGSSGNTNNTAAKRRQAAEIGRVEEDREVAVRQDQRLPQVVLEHRPEHEGQDQRRGLVAELAHQVAEHAEDDHHEHVEHGVARRAIDADDRRTSRSAGTARCRAAAGAAPTCRSAAC